MADDTKSGSCFFFFHKPTENRGSHCRNFHKLELKLDLFSIIEVQPGNGRYVDRILWDFFVFRDVVGTYDWR